MNSTFLPFLARVRNGRMKELKNASRGGKLDAGWKRCNPAPGCRHKLPKFDKISFTQSIQLTLVHSPQRQILDPLTPSPNSVPGPGRAGLHTGERRSKRGLGWSSFLVSPSWKIFCKTFFHSMSDVTKFRDTWLLAPPDTRSEPLTQDPGLMSD